MKTEDRVVATKDGAMGYHKGDIGVIEKMWEPYHTAIDVRFDNGRLIGGCNPGNFREVMTFEQVITMTKEEALKTAIDGQKMQYGEWWGSNYLYYKDHQFCFHYSEGESIGASEEYVQECLKNYNDPDWKIYTPKPKFSKGDFFIADNGDFGQIIEEPVIMDGDLRYSVKYNDNQRITMKTPEASMRSIISK